MESPIKYLIFYYSNINYAANPDAFSTPFREVFKLVLKYSGEDLTTFLVKLIKKSAATGDKVSQHGEAAQKELVLFPAGILHP